jgi:hypothetical protein
MLYNQITVGGLFGDRKTLKRIFRKLDVSARAEMVARLQLTRDIIPIQISKLQIKD